MKQVFEDGIEIALCPKCECEYVIFEDDKTLCADCKEVIFDYS